MYLSLYYFGNLMIATIHNIYYLGVNDCQNVTGFGWEEMLSYAITTNKDSSITNNPNDGQSENPRYIFNLLLSIIRVSVETLRS